MIWCHGAGEGGGKVGLKNEDECYSTARHGIDGL
jgi:hypothetical protein